MDVTLFLFTNLCTNAYSSCQDIFVKLCQPAVGTLRKVGNFILWGPSMSVQNVMAIDPEMVD